VLIFFKIVRYYLSKKKKVMKPSNAGSRNSALQELTI